MRRTQVCNTLSIAHPILQAARQRDANDIVPLVVAHVDDVRGASETGIVHEHVDPSELPDGGATTYQTKESTSNRAESSPAFT